MSCPRVTARACNGAVTSNALGCKRTREKSARRIGDDGVQFGHPPPQAQAPRDNGMLKGARARADLRSDSLLREGRAVLAVGTFSVMANYERSWKDVVYSWQPRFERRHSIFPALQTRVTIAAR